MPVEPSALADSRLAGISHEIVRHGRVNSLEEAAAVRGVEPGAIVKTMVVRRGEDDYLFVLVPGDRVIDWPKLRNLLGERRLSLADADEARMITGYAPGTITPFGSLRQLPVIADQGITRGLVSVGGGAHGVSITIDGEKLATALEVVLADVTKTRG